MSQDLQLRALEIYEGIAGLDGDALGDALERYCGSDTELRESVQRLIAADKRLGEVLEVADFDILALRTDDASKQFSNLQIGPYKTIDVLGEGSMGVVYRARQFTPDREVALKLIRDHGSDRRIQRRFANEVESLGKLKHPAISRIYDAGIADTPTGRIPYIAMELVDGLPLDQYLQANALSDRNKLELLARICDAVAYAHHRGVIHRDLKPTNILVEGPSEDPHPHILDFGIARITRPSLEQTLGTYPGVLVGTLPYMSPEQLKDNGTAVDITADVYALGVMGYEMLAGSLPLNVLEDAIPNAIRRIKDEDPRPLSTIAQRYKGDVEAVFSKALEKEPDRRYSTAAALAADIRNHLAMRPITARSPTAMYRAAKFIRRRRGTVSFVGVALFAVASALTFAFYGLAEAKRQLRNHISQSVAFVKHIVELEPLAGSTEIREKKLLALSDEIRNLLALNPSNRELQAAFADVLQAHSAIDLLRRDFESARKKRIEALGFRHAIAEKNPDLEEQRLRPLALVLIGDTFNDEGKPLEALSYYRDALAHQYDNYDRNPTSHTMFNDLIWGYGRVAHNFAKVGDFDKANANLANGYALAHKKFRNQPEELEYLETMYGLRYVDLQIARLRDRSDLRVREKADLVDLARRIFRRRPSSVLAAGNLALSLYTYGGALRRSGSANLATEHFLAGIMVNERLRKLEPENIDALRLAITMRNAASKSFLSCGDSVRGRELALEAVELLEELERRGRPDLQLQIVAEGQLCQALDCSSESFEQLLKETEQNLIDLLRMWICDRTNTQIVDITQILFELPLESFAVRQLIHDAAFVSRTRSDTPSALDMLLSAYFELHLGDKYLAERLLENAMNCWAEEYNLYDRQSFFELVDLYWKSASVRNHAGPRMPMHSLAFPVVTSRPDY